MMEFFRARRVLRPTTPSPKNKSARAEATPLSAPAPVCASPSDAAGGVNMRMVVPLPALVIFVRSGSGVLLETIAWFMMSCPLMTYAVSRRTANISDMLAPDASAEGGQVIR